MSIPEEVMPSTHTRMTIETVDYECAMGDCGHNIRPCPSVGALDACRECTDRNWDENEGPVITWDECQGVGMIWLDDLALDEFDLSPDHTSPITEGVPDGQQ